MSIKINKDSIELTGKEFDIVKGFIKMEKNGELTLNLNKEDIINDNICNHKNESLPFVHGEFDMPPLNVEVLMNTNSLLNRVDDEDLDKAFIINMKKFTDKIDGEEHYLNFDDKECTNEEKKELLKQYLNKIDRPDLLKSLCETSNSDIIINMLVETFNMRSGIEVISVLDNIKNFIGFKNFMLFTLDFINYEEKCNHIGMSNPIVSHIDKYGKCDMCGKTISHDSLMVAKMLGII